MDCGEERLYRIAQDYDVLNHSLPTNVVGSGIGRSDVDLVIQDGGILRLAEVGGPAKGFVNGVVDPRKVNAFYSQLDKLIKYSQKYGGTPTFFYDVGTPKQVIDAAIKKLGAANVLPIPPRRW